MSAAREGERKESPAADAANGYSEPAAQNREAALREGAAKRKEPDRDRQHAAAGNYGSPHAGLVAAAAPRRRRGHRPGNRATAGGRSEGVRSQDSRDQAGIRIQGLIFGAARVHRVVPPKHVAEFTEVLRVLVAKQPHAIAGHSHAVLAATGAVAPGNNKTTAQS